MQPALALILSAVDWDKEECWMLVVYFALLGTGMSRHHLMK